MNKFECYGKLSRLFTPADLKAGAKIDINENQSHYLKNVLRKNIGDTVRFFNGKNGEFISAIQQIDKKGGTVSVEKQIRPQPEQPRPLHLLFAPIKKARMDFLIEKMVELGVSDIHPVITSRTGNRHLNESRVESQVIESAEQCERMDVPRLHPPLPLKEKLLKWDRNNPVRWCHERSDGTTPLMQIKSCSAFLIGPEGGFDEAEARMLAAHPAVTPVSLGENILRAETAAILCLAAAHLKA